MTDRYTIHSGESMSILDYDALTFDCYGTLIDWETGILEALRETLPSLDRDPQEILETFARLESEEEANHPTLLYRKILQRVHHGLARAWGLPSTTQQAAAFGASVARWPPFADSTEALRVLQQHYRLVILSNVDHESFRASQTQLGVSFDPILTAEEIGSYKPATRNFRFMVDRLTAAGISQNRLLHTAQSLFHDHAPASHLGLATCWIDRRHGTSGWGATPPPSAEVKPDYRFSSLAEMAAAVTAAAEKRTT